MIGFPGTSIVDNSTVVFDKATRSIKFVLKENDKGVDAGYIKVKSI